jgi:hypothetical protein
MQAPLLLSILRTPPPPPPPPPPPAGNGTGTGLLGTYFASRTLSGTSFTRVDPSVAFNWGAGAPDPRLAVDSFSVRWTGQVEATFSETYTFFTTSDDGVRLWVNGQPLINNWTDHGTIENQGTITLTAGQRYDLRMEFYENGGDAVATLSWSSPSTPKQTIPQIRLYNDTAPAGGGGTGGSGGTTGGTVDAGGTGTGGTVDAGSPPPPPPPGNGGLSATYWDTIYLSGNAITRVDPTVNFDWMNGSPDPRIPVDNFSARWLGQVQAGFSQTYTFYTLSDDGVRLWVNGQLLIDNMTDHGPTENVGTIALVAGQRYAVRMEFYERGGGATAILSWSSPSTPKQVIPSSALSP